MVVATLKFLTPTDTPPIYYASVGGEEARLDLEGQFEEFDVEITDGRPDRQSHSLDCEGYQLVDHASAVTDFYDQKQIASVYEEEVRDLVAGATDASRIVVFDHTHRADSKGTRTELKTR